MTCERAVRKARRMVLETRQPCVVIREGKAKFAPGTTNSLVDAFLDRAGKDSDAMKIVASWP